MNPLMEYPFRRYQMRIEPYSLVNYGQTNVQDGSNARGDPRSPGVVDGAIMVLPAVWVVVLLKALLSVASRTWANTAVVGAHLAWLTIVTS
jgi:hypothetical protein